MSYEYKKVCEECGEMVDDWVETSDGRIICTDCINDSGYFWCEYCETYHPEEEANTVRKNRFENTLVCTDCVETNSNIYTCAHCEKIFDENYMSYVEIHNGDVVCWDCYEYHYVRCEECGEVVPYDDAYENDDEGWLCSDCAGKRRNINSYSYKPSPRCKRKEKGDTIQFDYPEECKELLLGAELEIDWGNDRYGCANDLTANCEDIYIKRDSSLSDDGMEIVTHPCTLEYHMDNLGWDSICQIARAYGYKSHDTRSCGLHIHVGRAQLGNSREERDETVAKIIMLVDRHWEQLKHFSRRRRSQLDEWASPPNLNLEKRRICESFAMYIARKKNNNSRYMAINTTNRSTIEFRLFNGSLKPTTILAALQLVSNICMFAKNSSATKCMMSQWEEIVNYKYYNELAVYCKSRGMTEEDRLATYYFDREPVLIDGTVGVGDYVIVLPHPDAPAEFIGQYGNIVRCSYGPYSTQAIVEFEDAFSGDLWNCSGEVPSGRGYELSLDVLSNVIRKEI